MRALERCNPTGRDPVEVLVCNIVAKALRGSLITGAALAAACADGDSAKTGSMDPVDVDDGSTLIPTPLPADASLVDARALLLEAGAADASDVRDGGDASVDAGPLPLNAYDPCVRGPGFPVRADGLSLAAPADYVSVRTASGVWDEASPGSDEGWTRTDFTLISERGIACVTATSSVCESEVSHHPAELEQGYCVQLCTEWSVVTTRGNEVQRWATPSDMLALLGPIDSDDDAMMLVSSQGYDISCPELQSGFVPADSNLRYVLQTPEGRELIAIRYADTCPVVIRRFRLLVTPAGEIRELDRADFPGGGCVGRVPAGLESHTQRQGDPHGCVIE